MQIKIDNEFKNLIPPLLPKEKQELEESIKKEGCRDALVVWNQILLDGHNRKEIAEKLKIKYKIKEIKLKNRTEALIWIINNQLGRRNLSAYDRTRLALKKEKFLKPIAKEKQQEAGKFKWFLKYIFNLKFRLSQEVEAYRTEYYFLEKTHVINREIFAKKLSGKTYLYMVSYKKALEIVEEW